MEKQEQVCSLSLDVIKEICRHLAFDGYLYKVRSITHCLCKSSDMCKIYYDKTYEKPAVIVIMCPNPNVVFRLPLVRTDKNDAKIYVDWGDGLNTTCDIIRETSCPVAHKYEKAGEFVIRIFNITYNNNIAFTGGYYNFLSKIPSYANWFRRIVDFRSLGKIGVVSLEDMFSGTKRDLSNLQKSMRTWDTSCIKNMRHMFTDCVNFNHDGLCNWDVSSVTDMTSMFMGCRKFNQNLNKWNVSSLVCAHTMFSEADRFNGNISDWDTSKLENCVDMFADARAFQGDLSRWNVSSVTVMDGMFCNTNVNFSVSNWDVRKVKNVSCMFLMCRFFNQSVNDWPTESIVYVTGMFAYTYRFNQSMNKWKHFMSLQDMFEGAKSYNKNKIDQ